MVPMISIFIVAVILPIPITLSYIVMGSCCHKIAIQVVAITLHLICILTSVAVEA